MKKMVQHYNMMVAQQSKKVGLRGTMIENELQGITIAGTEQRKVLEL